MSINFCTLLTWLRSSWLGLVALPMFMSPGFFESISDIHFKNLMLVFQCLYGLAPHYLSCPLSQVGRSAIVRCYTRETQRGLQAESPSVLKSIKHEWTSFKIVQVPKSLCNTLANCVAFNVLKVKVKVGLDSKRIVGSNLRGLFKILNL